MNTIILFGALIVLIVGFIAYRVGRTIEKKDATEKIGSAESKARKLLDDAIKNAESTKLNALLEAKEEILKQRTELETEIRERRKEVADIENRALKRDELSEKKAETLDKKELVLQEKEEYLTKKIQETTELTEKRLKDLERISTYTKEQAKTELFNIVKEDIKHDTAVFIKEQEQIMEAKVEAIETKC